MKGKKGMAALIFLAAMLVSASLASTAGASLDNVLRGQSLLLADPDSQAKMTTAGIFVNPIAPAQIVTQDGAAGLQFPISGGTVETDTFLGTVQNAGGFSMQQIQGDGTVNSLDITDPQVLNGNTLAANTGGIPLPAPAADLVNATHSKNPCNGSVSYDAQAQVGAANALVLNTYFNTDIFTSGMVLGKWQSFFETIDQPAGDHLTGKSLLLTDGSKKKMNMISGAATLAPAGSSGDPVLNGGELRLCAGSGSFDTTYDLPASGWQYVGSHTSPKSYKFKSKGPIKSLEVKGGKFIKVVASGALTHSLAANPAPLDVNLHTGDHNYCVAFGGKIKYIANKVFQSKNAGDAAYCPS